MKWTKRLFIILVVFLAVIGLPFLIPLDTYIPEIEKQTGEKLHEPVKIGSLRFSLVPLPHVALQGITIGAQQEVRIASIKVSPNLSSLFSPVKILRDIELDTVSIRMDMLGRMPAWFKSEGGPQTVRIEKIGLNHVTLESPSMALPLFRVAVNMNSNGDLKNVLLASDDGKLKLDATPISGSNFDLKLTAKQWRFPVGPAFQFDVLNIAGAVDSEALRLKDIDGKLYGGTLKGAAELNWKSGWRLSGGLKGQRVALESLLPLFNSKARVSGQLNAQARFSMNSRAASQLADSPNVDGDFSIHNGVLHGFDLVRAAQPIMTQEVRGGQTEFDEFSGIFSIAGKDIRLRKLNISSGVLNANGEVEISPSKQLDGKIYAEVKTGVSLVSVPLRVSGTLPDPVLFPTGAAVTGAVVGTAILGPGVGTSLGVKAADKLDSWFGGKKK
ncbi:MAG: AsmA family protein [Sulfuricella sp.]|nr:AsmA family protein [Sulfuricella sp.]